MKKLLFLFALLLITYGSFAQAEKTKSEQKTAQHHQQKDCVAMENGKMMVMKDGQSMEMNQDMTMSNGATVMTDGTVKMKNGTTHKLKDGECVYMNGKMGHMKMKSENKKKS